MTDFLFNRNVRLVFTNRDDPSDVLTIEDPKIVGAEPLKIDFQVEKQLSTEPNRADIDISNLSDDSASKINFRKRFLEFTYGRKVEIFADYEGREKKIFPGLFIKKIFTGIVIGANTSREGTIKITRVECRNIFYELMQLPISRTFGKGESKSSAILSILKDIDAKIDARGRAVLNSRLEGQVFKDSTNFEGTAYNVINEINRGLLSNATIYFDDVATSFNPIGIPLDDEDIVYDASKGQILGTPQPTEIGVDFTIPLDPDLKMSSPVLLLSDTVRSFFKSGSEFTGSGRFVVKQIIHSGTNRADGVFQSRVISVFNRENLTQFTSGQVPIEA